jgi:hypothetical protein
MAGPVAPAPLFFATKSCARAPWPYSFDQRSNPSAKQTKTQS